MSEKKHKNLDKLYLTAAAIGILTVVFAFGAWYGHANRPAMERVFSVFGQQPPMEYKNVDFSLFWDVWSRLENKYVDKDKIDRKEMVYGAVAGLVKSLKDPHSEFMPPADSKQFQEDIKGSFDGIGAEIGMRKGILTVIAPLDESPAEKAGIKAGDKIIKIDDKSTIDLNLNEAVRLIRGKKGTEVKLTILRDSLDQAKEIKIIRDTIRVKVLKTEKKPDGVFVIKLSTFTEGAAREFRGATQEFLNSGSKKLVLDLRNNPGGFLMVSVDIASWFFDSGQVIARERKYDGTEEIYRSSGYRLLKDIPMVVLVNEGSASASEILAGALRDNLGVVLIGTKTFGKGSVQEVEDLPGGSSLKITIAKWMTPKGIEINGTGLEPDVKVELPKEEDVKEKDKERDWIMEKGLEVLKSL